MTLLAYKDQSTDGIFDQLRSTNFYSSKMLFSQNNILSMKLTVSLDLTQISLQADIFARQMYQMRADLDFKRFLGSNDEMWHNRLYLVYIYARVKAVFLGLKSNYTYDWPQDSYNFPGNILLCHYLKSRSFQFNSDEDQPLNIFVDISTEDNFKNMVKPIFEAYPELEQGMSDLDNNFSYVNSYFESILQGLSSARKYYTKKYPNENCYEIDNYDSEKIKKYLKAGSNPILNSYLNTYFTRFYYIRPNVKSGFNKLRFDESLFLPRAIGIISNEENTIEGNAYYLSVKRDSSDFLTKYEVYSITGLKTECVPYSLEQILKYLDVDKLNEGVYEKVERKINFRNNG